jgi:YkoY family integral membrane protein
LTDFYFSAQVNNMLDQTFNLADLPRLFTLAFVELSLSADNAIVLALLTRPLAPGLRKKALIIGSLSAFFFRALAILGVNFLLNYLWMQALGGIYLIYLSIDHFHSKKRAKLSKNPKSFSFWKTIFMVEMFDLAFAIDSILAGMAFINSSQVPGALNPKLWIVYAGGMIGLLGIRYAAHWFTGLIDRFPRLETSAFLLIGWIGLKLLYESGLFFLPREVNYEPLFWSVACLLLLLGFVGRPKKT